MPADNHIACHECDLLIELPALQSGQKAFCPRCNYLLTVFHSDVARKILSYSLTALVFLFFASLFPFLGFSAKGQERVVSLFQSITILADEGATMLAGIVLIAIVAIPGMVLIAAAYVAASLLGTRLLPGTKLVLRSLLLMLPWSMAEIFLVGILISFIKISAMAEVALGMSFWSYVLFNIFMTTMVLHLDKRQLWGLVGAKAGNER